MLRPRLLPLPSLLLAALLGACDPPVPAPPRVGSGSHLPPSRPVTPPPAGSVAELASAAPPVASSVAPSAPVPPIALHAGGKRAVPGAAGVVTSVEHTATSIGAGVLRRGGNAVDAAVAVAYALAVTHPSAGNIGGGGFMLVRLASGEVHAIDFRETAPAAATTERVMSMVHAGGMGYASAGVPGSVAGLDHARDRFGTLPLAELLAPAIALAKKGHRLGARQALVLSWAWPKLQHDAAARAVYGRGGKPLRQGDVLRQPDLARTLEAIAQRGDAGFYDGLVADRIERAMKAHGGDLTAADLRAYRAKDRATLRFSYRGFTVDTMPPPSMGGVALAEIMLQLERARAYEAPPDSGLSLHLFVEASRRAFADRRAVGADPDFMPPSAADSLLARLLDGGRLSTYRPPIDRERATPSADITSAVVATAAVESPETTHFSVVDAAGNAVSCTTTQSAGYGSKIVIPGTGVLLGNAMGAFTETGVNAVEPGKRMASSMAPTIVSQGDRLALVLGSPGGDTIPSTIAQVLQNAVDHGMTIDEAIAHGRIHHQYLPDRVRVEKGNTPPKASLDDLARRGHTLDLDATPMGDANDILFDAASGVAWGYSDTREGGTAEGIARAPAKAAR